MIELQDEAGALAEQVAQALQDRAVLPTERSKHARPHRARLRAGPRPVPADTFGAITATELSS